MCVIMIKMLQHFYDKNIMFVHEKGAAFGGGL